MKAQDFIQAMNDIDEKYIKEAAVYRPSSGNLKIWRAIAIAACACLAVSAVFMMTTLNQKGPGVPKETVRMETKAEAESAAYYADGAVMDDYDVMSEAAAEEVFYDSYEESIDAGSANALYDAAAPKAPAAAAGSSARQTLNSAIQAEPQAQNTPKIIYRVYMEMQTKEYDSAVSQIEQAIAANNGYSESQNQTNNSSTYRNANYSIRIPVENLDSFLAQAEEIGTVTYIDKSAEDVSESYYDIQSRLTSARAKLERLQQLLGQAEDMADIIELESAISDAQWEIDNYSGSLRYYDSQVDYSTVNISLREVYEIVTEDVPLTFGEKIAWAFSQGVRSVGEFFKNVVLWISASWIWLIIAAALITFVILLIRHIRHKNR